MVSDLVGSGPPPTLLINGLKISEEHETYWEEAVFRHEMVVIGGQVGVVVVKGAFWGCAGWSFISTPTHPLGKHLPAAAYGEY